MTFEEWLYEFHGIDDSNAMNVTEEQAERLYDEYVNSEYYNGEKGL